MIEDCCCVHCSINWEKAKLHIRIPNWTSPDGAYCLPIILECLVPPPSDNMNHPFYAPPSLSTAFRDGRSRQDLYKEDANKANKEDGGFAIHGKPVSRTALGILCQGEDIIIKYYLVHCFQITGTLGCTAQQGHLEIRR